MEKSWDDQHRRRLRHRHRGHHLRPHLRGRSWDETLYSVGNL